MNANVHVCNLFKCILIRTFRGFRKNVTKVRHEKKNFFFFFGWYLPTFFLISRSSKDLYDQKKFVDFLTVINEILKKTEILISLGGDGTLISIAGKVANQNAFIIGIHAGTLGFLTDILPDDFEKFLDEFLRGEYEIERPFMLEVLFEKNSGEIVRKLAFNDVVLNRNNIASMAKIDAYLNRKYFNTYFALNVNNFN